MNSQATKVKGTGLPFRFFAVDKQGGEVLQSTTFYGRTTGVSVLPFAVDFTGGVDLFPRPAAQ